ncbi:MAG: alanine racemase [Patescibacteria group bacterium]|nr:alanine racemase [Patescibacteria group bacterium]MDE1988729.1 alanine racemase [Patescibacteria group bacterium]MDE2218048.1 alanine racemase [Patescibacteria group bacterium]
MEDLIWIEVSKSAIENNLRIFRNIAGKDNLIAVAVKANAYGHGIKKVSKLLVAEGADWFCVNSIEEAEVLRKINIKKPILIMGFVQKRDLSNVIDLDSHIFLYDISTAKDLSEFALKKGKKANVYIKADTGLSRLGVSVGDISAFAKELKNLKGLEVEGVATHFATSDNSGNDGYFKKQLESFEKVADILKNQGLGGLMINGSNSASSIIHGRLGFDVIRAGIAIYGYHSSEYVRNFCKRKNINFVPALSLKTKVAQVKIINKGSRVSYGCDFISKKKMKIAILPIGYSDGLDRKLSNKGYVLIKGKRAKIIGRICMNMTIVDVGVIADVKPEDEVVIIGNQSVNKITADDIAKISGTINYEVLARLRESIPRYYV